ncbi:extracellular solute-binding protein [Verticiella sediminum]|uniref:Extracellular solute-binding protein n=1 Tax=Verticiella sediminum TaxID=1247510 RepID=A0A556AYR8_9BURK|nr:extracellular solute-binding protein [Verticiella sediminum]TSH98083.1 extracellular solute-binding protein [Verticiella sediminum]
MTVKMTRRDFTTLMGAAGAMSMLGMPRAHAAGGPVVVGTWGGDYQAALQKYIATPLVDPKGYKVSFDSAAESPRKVKLLAERRLPRGSMDVAALTASGSYDMFENDAIEKIDYSRVPLAEKIPAALCSDYLVPQYYTTRVVLYNPKFVTTAPTSYADLWNPEYAGRVGVIDIQYLTTIESAAMAFGGSLTNYEPGKEKLLELKKQGVRIYPTNEAMAQALQTGECWICIMWHARGVLWQNAGVPIDIAVPKEGSVVYLTGFALPRNARNKDGAYEFLNAQLEDSAQIGFAHDLGGTPAVEGVALPPELAKQIVYTPEQQAQFMMQDDAYLSKNDAQLKDWWDKVFKG